jgi:hypothetical protein
MECKSDAVTMKNISNNPKSFELLSKWFDG